MENFLVFAYDYYYPSGAMNDFIDDFEDEKDAINLAKKNIDDFDIVKVYSLIKNTYIFTHRK